MALGIGSVIKAVGQLKKGGLGPDELAEMLSTFGIEGGFEAIGAADRKGEFEALWLNASLPSAGVLRIRMRTKDGENYSGLLVLTPAPRKQA
jgi:hypothetical protein